MEKFLRNVGEIVQRAKIAQKESMERGELFNMFAACRVNHCEMTHSSIIAELLNPVGSHGQDTLYLSSFLKFCCPDFNLSLQGVKVRLEEPVDNGRVDILITNEDGQGLIIENKIFAQDQHEQLKRYDAYAQKCFTKGYQILYLTLNGGDASEDSSKGVKYLPVSYEMDIKDWLEECICQSSRLPLIRETLIQYQKHIKQLTNQVMENKEKKELLSTMVEHADQVRAIYSITWLEYLEYVFGNYVRPKLETLDGLIYKDKNLFGGRGERGFYFQRKGWHRSAIWVYTGRSQPDYFCIGISNCIGDSLEVEFVKLDCFTKQPDKSWPYGWIPLEKYANWYLDNDTIPDMINGKFVEYVTAKVKEILEEIDRKQIIMQ